MGEVNEFPIKPVFSNIVITLNELESDDISIEMSGLSDVQTVMATGDKGRFEVGQKVILDLNRMTNPQTGQIQIDPIEVSGVVYGFLSENLIKAIDNR